MAAINPADITIRVEQEQDHRLVEALTRDAFWNLYVPGASEHFLLHRLRQCDDYIKELSLVAEMNGEIVGHIAYTKSKVVDPVTSQQTETLTFGPFSVCKDRHGQGIGGILLRGSIDAAKRMGYPAIIIFGYPSFYERFGFRNAHEFGISQPDGSVPIAMQVLPLTDSFKQVHGHYYGTPLFESANEGLAAFDAAFEPRKKAETKSQQAFQTMLTLHYGDEVPEWVTFKYYINAR